MARAVCGSHPKCSLQGLQRHWPSASIAALSLCTPAEPQSPRWLAFGRFLTNRCRKSTQFVTFASRLLSRYAGGIQSFCGHSSSAG